MSLEEDKLEVDEELQEIDLENNIPQNVIKKKNKALRNSIIICVVLILFGIYLLIGYQYRDCFFRGIYINGIDCAGLSVPEASKRIEESQDAVHISVYARNEDGEKVQIGELTNESIDLTFVDTSIDVYKILDSQVLLFWPKYQIFTTKEEYQIGVQSEFSEDKLYESVLDLPYFQEMKAPEDAYISKYNEEIGLYEIVPEKQGNEIDLDILKNWISSQDLSRLAVNGLDLSEDSLYKTPVITSENKDLIKLVKEVNRSISMSIDMKWNGNSVSVDKNQLVSWVSVSDGQIVIDEEAISGFVQEQSKLYDTYGKSHVFHTTLGLNVTLTRGDYGWKTDVEKTTEIIKEAILVGEDTSLSPKYADKGYVEGENDIGNSYVEADMTNQHLYLYMNGALVLESDFVSGDIATGRTTPAGIYGITYKRTDAILRGRDYVTPVNYWMPFFGNYGMHDATWRTEFGGDIYLTDGSHGCLNLPLEKAAAIYEYMVFNFPVVCYYY